MNILKTYEISFQGLSNDIHYFDFEIDKKFFEAIEYSEIKNGKLKVEIRLEKQTTLLILDFKIKGVINVMCDRCTDFFDLPIEGNQKLVVKFGKENFEESDQVIVIPATDGEINMAHFIYEYISIFTPIQRVHPTGKNGKSACNKQMLKKLEELNVRKKEEIDPRWEALRNLN